MLLNPHRMKMTWDQHKRANAIQEGVWKWGDDDKKKKAAKLTYTRMWPAQESKQKLEKILHRNKQKTDERNGSEEKGV